MVGQHMWHMLTTHDQCHTLTGSTKEFKFPPIDFSDKNRCVLQGSNMGQSNAARDKLYDLRQCQLSGSDASGLDLSGVIMSKTDVSKAKFLETYFSKAYLRGALLPCFRSCRGFAPHPNVAVALNLQTATLKERTLRMQLSIVRRSLAPT
jgi:uncharacterized protein YjbI with pentapeptide repeats